MSMAGSGPEVLTTLTTDMGKILDGIHRTKIKGSANFTTAINVAAVRLFPVLCVSGADIIFSSPLNTDKTNHKNNGLLYLPAHPSPKMKRQ
jgi:hypothetical protein